MTQRPNVREEINIPIDGNENIIHLLHRIGRFVDLHGHVHDSIQLGDVKRIRLDNATSRREYGASIDKCAIAIRGIVRLILGLADVHITHVSELNKHRCRVAKWWYYLAALIGCAV